MNPIDLKTARKLIDFSGGEEALKDLSEMQIEGVVALQNRIVDSEIGFAYLADEVGMGKTYIALGVVAILRYFNPTLRVLYICPSRNVQEKWEREYKSFVRVNLRFSHGRLRTLGGQPATPYASCRNVDELLHYAASGYFADYFIGKDSFSISLTDDESEWSKKLERLKQFVPAYEINEIIASKHDVKEQFAGALNYILPTFDLVVIDEAHNFKHDFESSYRNQVLSRVLGVREDGVHAPRIKHALLLSATPYDRDLTQLRNQLKLIGRSELLPDDIEDDRKVVQPKIKRFMVRRLNVLTVNGEQLTRNMYRREWRSGTKAEICLETDEQKLVTALVQKKVGEMLTRQSESPSFQVGLLASFESFAESTQSPPVEFDGERKDKQQSDAKDRHVIGRISDSYVKLGLGRTLPHPKMDILVKRLANSIFENSRKQLVFVRRVKSVNEIKNKLDDAYNNWIRNHINQELSEYEEPRRMMEEIFASYREASTVRDDDVLGGEFTTSGDSQDESLPAKNDTFFAWFFRGKIVSEISSKLNVNGGAFPTPDSIRTGLVAKNQVNVTLIEPNWALFLCDKERLDLRKIVETHGEEIAADAGHFVRGDVQDDKLETFQTCQIAFIKWLIENENAFYLRPLFEHLTKQRTKDSVKEISKENLFHNLITSTLYTELEKVGLAEAIIPFQRDLWRVLRFKEKTDDLEVASLLKRFDIHKTLLSFSLRTFHGIVDVYLARLKQGPGNLTDKTRSQWIKDFVSILLSQKSKTSFSTFCELKHLAEHLDLIIKNNIPQILELTRDEYPSHLRQALSPVSPVIGASGTTSGRRSAQARKFRMPGYPLALVSTDVFQEGEDLHLFCDSVVHYGLSSTPVGLEQKAGRVDRVSSMAQRRLLSLNRCATDEELIQVTYPYVKESIEALQIRQICRNYNEFIDSLRKFSSDEVPVNDTVNLANALALDEDIQEQIRDRLFSPFNPCVAEQNDHCAVESIEKNEDIQNKKVGAICDLLNSRLGDDAPKNKDSRYYFDGDGFETKASNLNIKLNSARASGELILSLTQPSNPPDVEIQDLNELRKHMNNLSWRTFHRTFAIDNAASSSNYKIFFNAEMLVGDADSSQSEKISRLFERMEIVHDPASYQVQLSEEIYRHVNSINENTTIPIDRFEQTSLRMHKENSVTILEFEFGGQQKPRFQRVSLYLCDNRCIFLSTASDGEFSRKLPVKDLIKYTWVRNRNIDLVEFVLNPDYEIVGRVVHPAKNMQWEEFIYCAYTLAVETDRLEYLLHLFDRN